MEKAFFSLSIPEVKGLVEFSETAAHFLSEYNDMKLTYLSEKTARSIIQQ